MVEVVVVKVVVAEAVAEDEAISLTILTLDSKDFLLFPAGDAVVDVSGMCGGMVFLRLSILRWARRRESKEVR